MFPFRRGRRAIAYPFVFLAGWLFNFVYDIQVLSGFLMGWMTHSWLGDVLF